MASPRLRFTAGPCGDSSDPNPVGSTFDGAQSTNAASFLAERPTRFDPPPQILVGGGGARIAGLENERQIPRAVSTTTRRARPLHVVQPVFDPVLDPPDPSLLVGCDIAALVRFGVLPWRRIGGRLIVAAEDRRSLERAQTYLPLLGKEPLFAPLPRTLIQNYLTKQYSSTLMNRAEMLRAPETSCRNMGQVSFILVLTVLVVALALAVFAPKLTVGVVFTLALVVLVVEAGFKVWVGRAAMRASTPEQHQKRRHRHRSSPDHVLRQSRADPYAIASPTASFLPQITLMLPLLREAEVAEKLLGALDALRYPRDRLELLILVEDDDQVTKAALTQFDLPAHVRRIEVPSGSIRTKPRALNYGLPIARGDIIGIYDAEDRPEPDQLLKVAAAFAVAPPYVACLQGRLDFYNTDRNWITRCFTMDYATWYTFMLRGLAQLDLPIPLGGTTLFLRRASIEQMRGWDAHNVTEDAELGFRLYCAGYRVGLLDTVTYEEATSSPIAWIRQRSRWLKGFVVTWGVFMRDPVALWRRMGPKGFIGFQILVLFGMLSMLGMPLMLSFFVGMFGGLHPYMALWPTPAIWSLMGLMFAAEAVTMWFFAMGLRSAQHRRHRWRLPLLHIYFLMLWPAALKAAFECLRHPHFWDKTHHSGAD